MGRAVLSQQIQTYALCKEPTNLGTHESWLAICVRGRGTAILWWGFILLIPSWTDAISSLPGAGDRGGEGC